MSLARDLPRLHRLLRELGVAVPEGVTVTADPDGAGDGAIALDSELPVHQARQVMRALGASPDPAAGPLAPVLRALEAAPLIPGAGELEDPEGPPLEHLEPALDVHQVHEILLAEHRLALMRADVGEAQRLFERFARAMAWHVQVEDEVVMPAYRAAEPEEGWERGAAPAIVDNEHGKILHRLRTFRETLDRLSSRRLGDEARAVACLHLLDREKVFVDLLEHHDHRERAFVYPHLEGRLPEAEKRRLVDRLVGQALPADDR